MEEEQQGNSRAKYGMHFIKELAYHLTIEFGKGFTEANLKNFCQFYLTETCYALRSKLTWNYYRQVEGRRIKLYFHGEIKILKTKG